MLQCGESKARLLNSAGPGQIWIVVNKILNLKSLSSVIADKRLITKG
jgi:hypothetical protein